MILGADYITKDGKPIVRIFKKENGEFKIELDPHFQPYIYALLSEDSAIDEIKQIKGERHGKTVRILDAVKVEKKFLKKPVKVWKLILEHPQDVPAIRNKIREHPAVLDIYEYDIPFAKRYLIDKGLIPMEGEEELKMLAFDIETFYHEGDEFGKGEIIMISYADEEGAGVITWKNIDLPYVDVVSNEREMVKRFIQIIKEKDPDVIITYNGDNFDLPYLIKRAEKLGLRLILSRDKENSVPKIQRMGNSFAVEIKGRIHFDLFPVVKRAINLPTYTLEAVYEAVLGKHKSKLGAEEIAAIWETGEGLKKLAQYSMEDAKATYELGREFFPMEAELAKLIGQSVWDVSRSSTGNLVEWYMLRVAYERNELAPNRPSNEEYKRRLRTTYLGGYVKEPERGLWGNIAYLDFRCHPADTKVLVKGRGIVNISEVKEGDYILGIDGWQKVRKVWEYYYESELININGLKCTPNHKIPVVTENDRQTMIRDSLARSFLSGKVKGKIITTKLFEKIAEFEKNKPSEGEILKGELSGIILAEGTLLRKDIEYFDSSRGKKRISHQYRVEITIGENEKELLERILYIFDKLFGIKPSVKKKGDTNALKIITAKKAVYLQIEEFLRNIENLYAPAVLRGFFEGDGTVNKIRNTVVATQGTNNKWKIDIVAKLLDSLGIPYSRYEYKYVENGKELTRHILEITGRDGLILFQTLVGFISSEKNESLKKAIEVREMNRLKNNSFYSLSTFEVSSEYYKGKVYDLTLEGTPYYFANGILTHNSLYPSIIVTHNVSPDTLERKGCQNYDVAPIVGYKFCKDFSGFIPSILEDLIETRQKIKKEMKSTIDPIKKKMLDYRQRAVKLLANSILPNEWLPIIENEEVKFVKIGEFIDRYMEEQKNRVRTVNNTEVLEVDNLFAFSLNRESKESEVKKVKALIRHKYRGKVYEIRLNSGRKINITGGHSLFTIRNGKIREVSGAEIKDGDLIVVPKKVKLNEKEVAINIPELISGLPDEATADIIMTIPVKGRKNFFKGMLRTLRWIFGEESKRIRTFNRYLSHLEKLGFVKLLPRGYEVTAWERLKRYKQLYEKLVKSLRYNGNKREYSVRFNEIKDFISYFPQKELEEWKIGTLNGFRMDCILKIDENFGKFLGYYISEGYAEAQKNKTDGMSYSVKLYNENPDILGDMKNAAERFFGKVRVGKNCVDISKKMAYLLMKCLCGVAAENKRIPPIIFDSPEPVRWAFLEAYFAGDGDIHPSKRPRLSTKSELLANQLVFFLNSLGVSSVKIGFDSGVYRVYINEDLQFLQTSREKNTYYSNLIPKEILEEIFGRRLQKNMTFGKFKEFVDSGKLDKRKAKLLDFFLNGDIVLDRVKNVKKREYEGYVYDLSVEGNENFLVGFGLLYAHNSYYGYMGYPKARWYSKECAESVTAWGRHYIEMTIREIEEKFGFKVLYADSVTSDTEIIVKRNGRVEFVPIEKLFERVDYRVGEKEYCILEGVEALTLDNRGRLVWKKIPYVMRHKAKKKVYRIWIANSWYIDVTEDHSLIVAEDGLKEAKPVEVEGKSLIATKDDLSGVEYIKPRTIEEIPYDGYVYDIEVEGTHRFFANGILVHNTDGFYATIPGETPEIIKKKAKEFLNYINSKLPGLLELEYEGFYLRGFFVTKKRYAVIDEEGKITTRGLEVVRRDWSEIAKETQARVLEAILREGSVEKAVEIVKEVVEAITKYKVPLEKLVIHEQITRELRDYKAVGPHVAIAKRLAAKGIKIKPGTIISYIVLRGSGKISDRVVLLTEYDPRKHKYDPDYYIENQVLPAVLRILEAFGYRKEDLKYQSSKQTGLESWLKR